MLPWSLVLLFELPSACNSLRKLHVIESLKQNQLCQQSRGTCMTDIMPRLVLHACESPQQRVLLSVAYNFSGLYQVLTV